MGSKWDTYCFCSVFLIHIIDTHTLIIHAVGWRKQDLCGSTILQFELCSFTEVVDVLLSLVWYRGVSVCVCCYVLISQEGSCLPFLFPAEGSGLHLREPLSCNSTLPGISASTSSSI